MQSPRCDSSGPKDPALRITATVGLWLGGAIHCRCCARTAAVARSQPGCRRDQPITHSATLTAREGGKLKRKLQVVDGADGHREMGNGVDVKAMR